ncbi:spermatogenesis-associated protein 31E1-like isoform X2 [Peromyscus eremicus]|uniref:spermatogenesis-associated protein 31E1-like isoform X2 n=1 Tax=Peromyscus eremicus TaxID=42410 RepID=UPI0027DBC8B1|nr:spermatogenesis-associated protein 31E1-like isoform X2 [Peromyscus eremicus]
MADHNSWLTSSFTTWAMDMILAFVYGLGLFHLLLLLHLNSRSPPPAENTTTQKVVKREYSKVRKKIRTMKAYRGSRKKPKGDKVLVSLLHSMLERLVETVSFCQLLGQDASGEASKPEAAKAHLPPSQPTAKSVATSLSLAVSSASLKDSKISSPVLLNSSASTESQFSVSACQPPETLTPGRCYSPPRVPSHLCHPPDPVACSPPMPDPSTKAPWCDWKTLGTSQSTPLPGLPSPIPTTPGLDHSIRPTSTIPGLDHSRKPTSTKPGLDQSSWPTSTTPDFDYSIRPTSNIPGLNHSSRGTSTIPDLDLSTWPTSTTPGLNHSSSGTSTTPGLDHSSRPTTTTPGLNYSSRPTSTSPGLYNSSRGTSTTPGLDYSSRPTSTTPGLNHSSRPRTTTPGLNYSSRPTSTSPGRDNSSRGTSTTPGLDTSSRPTSTTPGLNHSSSGTSITPGLDYSSRPTSTTQGLNHSSRGTYNPPGLDHSSSPTSTTPGPEYSCRPPSNMPGLDHSSRPNSTTPGLKQSSRPTSTSPGLDLSSRLTSGPSWYQVAAKTWCHSNSPHGESSKDHLFLSLQKASFWTGPTYMQIDTEKPSFINPDIQERLELEIQKRVELKVWKGKGKERCDHALGCMDNMLQSWSSQQATTRTCKSEQFSGHQQFFYKKYSQLFWGLPFLHSESLVVTVNMAGSPPEPPSILFNGLSTYIPTLFQTNVHPQLFSPKPLLQYLVKTQPLTPKLSRSQSPPADGIQTQSCDPSSLPKLPDHSPPIRDYGASCPRASRVQFMIPPAAQHLERHLLKKHQESKCDLPPIVKRSQEAFHQLNSNTWASQGKGSVVHLPGNFINSGLQQQLEQHLKETYTQRQCPHKVQLSQDPSKSQDKLPGMGQAEVNHGTSCSSALTDESSLHAQSVSSQDLEIFQIWMDPSMYLTNDLYRSPEDYLGKVLGAVSKTEAESGHMRHPKTDTRSVSPVGLGKKLLEGTPKNDSSSNWRQAKDSKVHVGICHAVCMDHALAPPENLNDCTTYRKTSSRPSFLDPGTQKVLETHLTRRLVRHRWSLPLIGLKTIHVFNKTKATTLPFPQPSDSSLSFWDSRDDSIVKKASVLGESFQKGPDEKVKTTSTQNPLSASQLGFLRETPPRDNSGPSEAPTTVKGDNMSSLSTSQSLVGRDWHNDMVIRSWTGNPESNPGLVKGAHESQEREHLILSNTYNWVSVREISVASQSTSSRDIQELEKEEEEQSCDCVFIMEAGEMANSESNHQHLRGSESLEPSESPSPSTQDPEDSGLSTLHCSSPGAVLQDCATESFYKDCAPEVLLAADILASRASLASQSSFKNVPATSKSIYQGRYSFLREGDVPQITKQWETWPSHMFVPTDKKECQSPRQDTCLSGMKPVQAYRSNTKKCSSSQETGKFGDRIKSFIRSIFNPKAKLQENSLQKAKSLPATTQSPGSVPSRLFMAQQVAEAQDLMTSVGWILEEKLGVHHLCAPSKKNLHQEPPQAQVSRPVCHHRIPTAETIQGTTKKQHTSSVHQANPKVQRQPSHSQPSTDRWMPYGNWAQVSREPVSRPRPYQHRAQVPRVPRNPVHCPRHCPYRSGL